jgi:c-di-GMP-binding flagellar brake protein YcgR
MGEIRENQLTKLFFSDAEGSEKELNCGIKKVYKDRIFLDYPKEIMDYVDYLQEGDDVSVKIFTPSGIKAYDAIVLNSPLENDFVIEFVENYIEIQRRKYLRMDFEAKVLIEYDREKIVTHTIDIGGGGIRFSCEDSFEPNQTVSCHLFLPEFPAIQAQGIIIKEKHLKDNEYVMFFTKIDEKDRTKLLQKCFSLQVDRYN